MFVNYISKILVLIGFASNDDGYMVISKYNHKKRIEIYNNTLFQSNQFSYYVSFSLSLSLRI